MTDNVRKIFDILGIEPNEKFKLKAVGKEDAVYCLTENLIGCLFEEDFECIVEWLLREALINPEDIVKLPKETKKKKKKLRDLTPEEWDKWKEICSYTSCSECIFRYVSCIRSDREECWIHHKDLYSDKFLDQEIEVEDEQTYR